MSNTEFDEQMLNELESRMNLLNNLKRKYGKDINELITYKDKLQNEIDKIEIMKKVHHNYVRKLVNYMMK